MNSQEIMQTLEDLVLTYGPKLIYSVLTLIIGLWVIKAFGRALKGFMQKREMDPVLVPYIHNITTTVLKVLLAVTVMSMVGIEMTSFVAILGAAGLAVGLALSGTLQNFAGGIMILIFKPFKVGDYVEMAGYSGTVKEIQVFVTILKTPDAKIIIIPNSKISNDSLVNYSVEPQRRVDMTFGIGYTDDIDKARAVIKGIIDKDERILQDPAYQIVIIELADSSVNFAVRVWVDAPNYWGVFFDMQETVKKTFDKEGISIPFPQRDVHLFQEK